MIERITPVVKSYKTNGNKISLGKLGDADFKVSYKSLRGELSNNALAALYDGLSSLMNVNAQSATGSVEIILQVSENVPEEVDKNADQAYLLKANASKIELTGFGEAGLYYAVNTFLQTVSSENNEFFVPEMEILDFPDLKTRGHFVETRFGSNLMTLDDWKAVVDDMVRMKLNQLVVSLYGCWCVQYDNEVSEYIYISIPKYPLLKKDVVKKYYSPKKGGWVNEVVEVPMAKEDFFGELVKYGKSKGVEILPLWNSLGHNTLIPTKYPETAPIVNGEPSRVGFCVSSPKTYELLFEIYDTIIDKYLAPNGVKSFHIGLDEVRTERAVNPDDLFRVYSPWCECEECSKLTNQEKMITHAIKLITHLKSRGMKNIYMYNDLLSRIFQDPNTFRNALVEADLLDVTVVDWWNYTDVEKNLIVKTLYPELNMRSTVKPWNSYYHWSIMKDSVWNVFLLSKIANRDGAEGLQSYNGWDKTCDVNHVAMADYSWNFDGTGSVEEYRDRYALRNFPNSYETAKKAVHNFAKLTEVGSGLKLPTDEQKVVCCNELLKNCLGYYGHSYPSLGLSYPRNFPGEPLGKLLECRDVIVPQMKEFIKLADKTIELFEELCSDVTGNAAQARRYAAEAKNHRDILEDYLVLLEIHDILKGKITKTSAKKIAEMAKERKLKRLGLIREMESFKEEYLHASHLRNQSIFMQMFADIEAYANTTAPKDFRLDVTDMARIGSKTFFNLR